MTKEQCKGLKASQIPEEIRQVFETHIEITGDPSLKWDRLFRFLVMENNRFPADEQIEGICADFFSAVHGGEVERFGSTIEAHLRAFGSWFPRYFHNKLLKRSAEALYRLPDVKPIQHTPKPSEPVTRQNWNLMQGVSLAEIKRNIAIVDSINQAPDENRKNRASVKGVSGVDNFMARCRESLRRYQIATEGEQ